MPSRPPSAATPSPRCCKAKQRYDLVVRYLPQYRDTKEAIENIRLLSPSGERVSLAQLCNIEDARRRFGNLSRGQLSATSRSSTACAAATWAAPWKRPCSKVNAQVQCRADTTSIGRANTKAQKRAEARLFIIVPLTILLIFMILYTMFHSFKWAR